MVDDEQCPKCGAVFPADRAWADQSITASLLEALFVTRHGLDARVRCPTCGTVFQSKGYRFLGFVSPSVMRAAGWAFVMSFACAAIYFFVFAP